MRHLLFLLPLTAFAASILDHPTGPRMTPPTLNVITPVGIARGTTVELTVEGLNLAKASAIYFSEPSVKGTILRVKELPDLPDIRLGSNGTPSTVDVGPLPPRNQVTVEVDVSPDAPIGPVSFRLLTPLGTSPVGRFLVEPYYGETANREPDDTLEEAVETYLPAILTGTISKPGDTDLFKIEVKAGSDLTFDNPAGEVGSTLQPVIAILDDAAKVIAEYDKTMFSHHFDKAGTYYVRVADFQENGKSSHFYRIKVGKFPIAESAWPLGLERGKAREVALKGWNLPAAMSVTGNSTGEDENAVIFRPKGSFNELRLAIGDEPELDASPANTTLAAAQAVSAPVTINGRIAKPHTQHFYRIHARKGEKYTIDVNARRLGSELDSVIDVLDATGKPVERATVRSLTETSTTLSDRDSLSSGLRLLSWSNMEVGDYLMLGAEIARIAAIPNGPDEDVRVDSINGQRLAFFDTTPEAHAIDQPVYKIQIHPPGTKFAPNGLPVVHLDYRNDDGGPGYDKDSSVRFTAPADGDYIVRLADVRGAGGDRFPYRLTIRAPRPDFRLAVSPRNPNVPAGGCIPVRVSALRMDDYDGPINVEVLDLPSGLHATKAIIQPGEVSATILLSADAGAKLDQAAALKVKGTANSITHWANPEDKLKLIALGPKPDVLTNTETKVVEIVSGETAKIDVRVQRQNGFAGRVPVAVHDLPERVKITDVGLNGVLLNEDESQRTFTIRALPNAEPMERTIYLSGMVETRSNQQNAYAAPVPILLRVKSK